MKWILINPGKPGLVQPDFSMRNPAGLGYPGAPRGTRAYRDPFGISGPDWDNPGKPGLGGSRDPGSALHCPGQRDLGKARVPRGAPGYPNPAGPSQSARVNPGTPIRALPELGIGMPGLGDPGLSGRSARDPGWGWINPGLPGLPQSRPEIP